MDRHEHDEEWYKKHLEGIQKLDPKWRKENIEPVTSGIKYSIKVEKAVREFKEFEENVIREENRPPTFSEFILEGIQKRGLSPKEFYLTAKMDRKLFSAIKTNKDYKPKKETAVACCFALGLSIDDAEWALSLAGFYLSMSIQWDRVVYYCFKEGITEISDVNDLLYELGKKLIRQ